MELNRQDLTKNEKLKAVLCISFGTGIGLIVYGIFLYFHIDIYGWNLGLIFAPLAAGYAETILANRILGEDIGAISAFILSCCLPNCCLYFLILSSISNKGFLFANFLLFANSFVKS